MILIVHDILISEVGNKCVIWRVLSVELLLFLKTLPSDFPKKFLVGDARIWKQCTKCPNSRRKSAKFCPMGGYEANDHSPTREHLSPPPRLGIIMLHKVPRDSRPLTYCASVALGTIILGNILSKILHIWLSQRYLAMHLENHCPKKISSLFHC